MPKIETADTRGAPMKFAANSLEHYWMPFTANRDFKADPRIVLEGEGVFFVNHYGGKVLDGSSGLFCTPCGHGRHEIAKAVHDQLLRLDYCSPFKPDIRASSSSLAGSPSSLPRESTGCSS